jgi:hypothetical protein
VPGRWIADACVESLLVLVAQDPRADRSKQVTFYGADCGSLQNGAVEDLIMVCRYPRPPTGVH